MDGLVTFNKIQEKLIAELIISDMKKIWIPLITETSMRSQLSTI